MIQSGGDSEFSEFARYSAAAAVTVRSAGFVRNYIKFFRGVIHQVNFGRGITIVQTFAGQTPETPRP